MTEYLAVRTFRRAGPARVLSGDGAVARIGRAVDQFGGRRVLLATGSSLAGSVLSEQVADLLGHRTVGVFGGCVQHAPRSAVDALVDCIADTGAEVVVALGGSSVSDCVKLASWTTSSGGEGPVLPYVAVPTTLSAGEFTDGAGYVDPVDGTKRTLSDPRLVARCVVLDPAMTILTPPALWASTGLKAVEHAIEALWSRYAHPLVDAHALGALRLLARHLPGSVDTADIAGRAACQVAAWMSIAGVSAGGLRLSHVVGHQVGVRWGIGHGVTSAVLLPSVMRYLAPMTAYIQAEIAQALGVDVSGLSAAERAEAAATAVESLAATLGLPTTLAAAGAHAEDVADVAAASFAAAGALGLTADLPRGAADVADILRRAW